MVDLRFTLHLLCRLCLARTLAGPEINNIGKACSQQSVITAIRLSVLWLAFGSLLRLFRNRRSLIFESFVLRQQLAVLKRRRPRPALKLFDWRISRVPQRPRTSRIATGMMETPN